LFFNGDSGIATDGHVNSSFSINVGGVDGTVQLSFVSGQTMSQILAAINKQTASTGVEAALIDPANSALGLVFRSKGYGTSQFVSVTRADVSDPDNFSVFHMPDSATSPVLGSTFDWLQTGLSAATQDKGRNVSALVNGSLATGKGLEVSLNSPA